MAVAGGRNATLAVQPTQTGQLAKPHSRAADQEWPTAAGFVSPGD